MALTHEILKERQRKERDSHPEALALRVHRALSWLDRAEQCNDEDGRFVFLWIAFNAAYANELGEQRMLEGEKFSRYLARLVELDTNQQLYNLIWQRYSGAIRVLLDNPYVYQPFWDHRNGLAMRENWESRFAAAKRFANTALAGKDTASVLAVVFNRLYTLRNQLIHGGATWNSRMNRSQLRDANAILGKLVPVIIGIMMDNAGLVWGDASYPPVS
ncbi:HEPN domain-containing protein [uncultured Oceanisphaera sp.]|uniref:HEPN domain-containing protein n=1 Tax=uncultured Oceanisphaera sp. TaxID=353858 RepID=UPI00262A95BC|nr:HEPN domain-containing protein [uncultured Oceanisphaera sp.]